MIGLQAFARYNFETEQIVFKAVEIPPYEKNWESILTGSAGIRNIAADLRGDSLVQGYIQEGF